MGPPTLSSKVFSASHVFFCFFFLSCLSAAGRAQRSIDTHTNTHNTQCLYYRPGRMYAAIMTPATHGRARKKDKTNKDTLRQPQR